MSLIIMDIDFFKLYNDEYGHQSGDECLKRVAQTLANNVRRTLDQVARYGGEEFVCVLPETDFQGAVLLAEKMRKEIEHLAIPHEKSKIKDHVTLSLGCATIIPKTDAHPAILLEAADRQLYRAKTGGRNCVKGIRLN